MTSGGVIIKALHITELRTAINDLRTRRAMSAHSWQTPIGPLIKADPIVEMREVLDQTLGGPPPPPGYSLGLAQFQPILAIHIQELRNRVVAAWNTPVQIPVDGHGNLSYDAATNRITTPGFAYDAAGNQVRALAPSGGSQRFQYDAANRLVKVKTDNNEIIIASYTYGDSNERLILEEAGVRTYYACDGSAEYTESGGSTTPQWSKTYIYLGARLLSTLTPNGSGGEAVQYHHPDRLGTRLVTNAQDTNSFEQVTLPFGTALTAESTGATNRRFTTYDRSLNTGLDNALNRHYDPRQGRFTQVDPIGMQSTSLTSPQTLNLYAYCANDPINHTDPSGLGFFSFLKRLFGKIVSALKAAVVAFVVAFVGSGGDFKKARRAGVRAFVSSFGFETRIWRPTGTAPTFPTGTGRPELHQIFQGTILAGLFPSPQSYLRWVNGFQDKPILQSQQGRPCDTSPAAVERAAQEVVGKISGASLGIRNGQTVINFSGNYAETLNQLRAARYYSGVRAFNPIHHRGGYEFRTYGSPGFHFKVATPYVEEIHVGGRLGVRIRNEPAFATDLHIDCNNPVGAGAGSFVRHVGDFLKSVF